MKTSRIALAGLFCVVALGMAGCRVRPCKEGTVYLDLIFDGASATANLVEIQLQLGDGSVTRPMLQHTDGAPRTTVELDFPGGYPSKDAVLHVTVRALVGTVVAGMATQDISITAGCTSATVTLGGNDLAGVDLAGIMPPDLSVGGVGAPCDTTSACLGGLTCVDNTCCTTPCTDQCAACDVPGSLGTCMPVTGPPHGARLACLGTDPCTGSCDGTTTTACKYPTTTCGVAPSCSAGVGTPAGMCQTGMCMQPTMSCADSLCGATACETVVQIAQGYDFGCALISDGTVRCWGWNKYGQLGLGESDVAGPHTPTTVPGLTGITQIAVGDNHACALKLDTSVTPSSTSMYCWGRNDQGGLGRGTSDTGTTNNTPQPVCLTGTLSSGTCSGSTLGGSNGAIKKIAAGGFTTCAIAVTSISGIADNHLYCWGYGFDGEMGNNTTTGTNPNPVAVCHTSGCPTPLTANANGGVSDVTIGLSQVCALDGANNVYCWGDNNAGQSGGTPNSPANELIPVAVANVAVGMQKPIAIAAGPYISYAIVSDGNDANNLVRAWGNGGQGARGGGDSTVSTVSQAPSTVCKGSNGICSGNLTGATSIAVTGSTSHNAACAVVGGAVYCWGMNDFGQLGKGDVTLTGQVYVTTAVPSLVTSGATSVAADADGFSMCAVLNAGGASRCWGDDKFGELGDGSGNGSAANSKGTPVKQSW